MTRSTLEREYINAHAQATAARSVLDGLRGRIEVLRVTLSRMEGSGGLYTAWKARHDTLTEVARELETALADPPECPSCGEEHDGADAECVSCRLHASVEAAS